MTSQTKILYLIHIRSQSDAESKYTEYVTVLQISLLQGISSNTRPPPVRTPRLLRGLCGRWQTRFRHFLVDHHCKCVHNVSNLRGRHDMLHTFQFFLTQGIAVVKVEEARIQWLRRGLVRRVMVSLQMHTVRTCPTRCGHRMHSPPSMGASTLPRPRSAVWARMLGTSPSDRSPAKMKCERVRVLCIRSEQIDTLVGSHRSTGGRKPAQES